MPPTAVSDLHAFVHSQNRNRSAKSLELAALLASGPLSAHPGDKFSYARELSISGTSSPPRSRQRESDEYSVADSSAASAATRHSTVFDRASTSVFSTGTSAPSLTGPTPAGRERPPVPMSSFAMSHSAADADIRVPCEFRRYADCTAEYGLHEMDELVEHVDLHHLRGVFPIHTICWFCNDAKFDAVADDNGDREACYRRRMEHISSHYQDGETTDHRRPDFHFLDHLHDYGLIEEYKYREARVRSEIPLPEGVVLGMDGRPVRGAGRVEDAVVETTRPARGGALNRPVRSQQYHL